jgi:hypothetical protein
MFDRLRKALPWVAAVCGLLVIVGVALLSCWRTEILVDSGETLASVEESLQSLTVLQPTTIDDARFMNMIEEVASAPHLATLWLLTPDGEVVQATGATARSFSQGTAQQHSSVEIQRMLSTLPDDALTSEQQTLLHVASAIQREGEHNDIYRHIVRSIRAPDGSIVALIGIAYEISPEEVGLGWKALVLLSLLSLLGYWLALPLWTWLDARQRGDRAWTWSIFVLLGNVMALLAYLLVRDPGRPQAG